MSSVDWNGKVAEDHFHDLMEEGNLPGIGQARSKWEALEDDERPKFENSEEETRRLLLDFYGWTKEETEEKIDRLKREMKLQAFK